MTDEQIAERAFRVGLECVPGPGNAIRDAIAETLRLKNKEIGRCCPTRLAYKTRKADTNENE